jgi:hypothetical protein
MTKTATERENPQFMRQPPAARDSNSHWFASFPVVFRSPADQMRTKAGRSSSGSSSTDRVQWVS